jgi:hypothetical protein
MFTLEGQLLPGVAFGRERLAIWRWDASPIGPASALGRIDGEGRLTIYTAAPAYADLLRVWHRVHDVKRGEVRVALEGGRLRAIARPDDAAEVEVDLALGQTLATRGMNLALALTLPCVRESDLFVRASGPLARALLGVGPRRGFAGRTETGVPVRGAARRIERVRDGRALVGGADCGAMRVVDDPPDWGEIVMPRLPYLLTLKLFVDAPMPDLTRARATA